MRIDGRFDPKAWVQPQSGQKENSTKLEEQRPEREIVLSVSEQRDADAEFAVESQHAYAYTHSDRVAANITRVLEATPDL
jgi:hypothetical protein